MTAVAMLKLMLAPLPTARQILRDHRIDYVVTCAAATDEFVKLAPDGLEARLGRGETPDFLEPLDLDPPARFLFGACEGKTPLFVEFVDWGNRVAGALQITSSMSSAAAADEVKLRSVG